MNKKVDRRITRSKRLLKHSLISLLNEKNFSDITITDLVNHSDLNRSTFYAHFRDKEDLLDCVINELLTGMIKSMKTEENSKSQFSLVTESSKYFTLELFTYVSEHSLFFKTLMNYHRVPHFSYRLSESLYCFYLTKIKEEHHSSNQLNMNHGFLANYIASSVVGFIFHWIVHTDNKYHPEYICKEFHKICFLNNDFQNLYLSHK